MKIEAFLRESPLVAVFWTARRLEAQLKERNLNLSIGLVLVSILFEEPRPVTPSQLAAVLSMKRANMSHLIASLEAEGLVGRRIDPEDARVHQLMLRPQGKKVAMQVVRVLHQMQTLFEKKVGPAQIRKLIEVLREIEQAATAI